jgi:hypothetical protein
MAPKQERALAIRREASLAATAWNKLEHNAQAVLNDGEAPTSVRLVADARGITMHVKDKHGAHVILDRGTVSVIAAQTEAE